MNLLKPLLVLAAVGVLGAIAFVYFGVFDVAADEPHSKPVFTLMEAVRQRSVAIRAKGIEVPALDDPTMISTGGADFNEMCTECHLRPGMDESELRDGLYPKPPNLAEVKRDPAQTFWIIKHGIKMTAMPAWGATHDDRRIWAMVAFLQQLPRLTPVQYQILTARSHGESGGHQHGGMENHAEMDGMDSPDAGPAATESHGGHSHGGDERKHEDASAPAAAVDSFVKALSSGNEKEATKWLAPDVLVYESGHAETSREQYVAEHMKGDMAFLSKAKVERLEHASNDSSDVAWVTARSRIRGESEGKKIDVLSTETMVLKKEAGGWRIKHIHWSSGSHH